jgi:pimeloyl-ACP methyl ester carboxylesterase
MTNTLNLPIAEAGTGRPALVLHGGGGPFTVQAIGDHLAATMHTYLPTHPGWNGVPLPDSIRTIADLAALYTRFLEVNDLRDVLVVGSSVGGWIAAELAARDTDGRITGVVIVDGTGILVPGAPIVDFFALDPRGVADHSYYDPEKFFVDPANLPPERVAAQRGNMATLKALAGDMYDPTLEARLATVETPTLILWGDSDRIVTPAYGKAYAAAFGNAQFELIPHAGHLPHFERPAATFSAIDRFAEGPVGR